MSKKKNKKVSKKKIASIAYQVIGSLSYEYGKFDNQEIIKALDYFSAHSCKKRPKIKCLLPWSFLENGD